MKKILFLLLFVLVAGFTAQVSAQIYSEPVQRCKQELQRGGTYVNGGTLYLSTRIDSVIVSCRSKELYRRKFTTGGNSNFDFYYDNNPSDEDQTVGALAISYKDVSAECGAISVVAGQEVEVRCVAIEKTGYANAVMYVDWDGNGVFDDHDPDFYNLYGLTNVLVKEYNNYILPGCNVTWGGCGYGIKPEWTIRVPNTINSRRTVRVRVRVSEGVEESLSRKADAMLGAKGIVAATNVVADPSPMKQYFYTSNLFAFMPSGALTNGETVDFEMTVEPDSNSPMTGTPVVTVQNSVGAVGCAMQKNEFATRMEIATAEQLTDWINNKDGIRNVSDTAILTANIVLPATAFTAELNKGVLEGNGHTISISGTAAQITTSTTDDSFFPYGLDYTSLATNIKAYNYYNDVVSATGYPTYNIAGGLFGKIGAGATVRNLKINYSAATSYSGNNNMIFGLVAGVTRGRIENVKVELNGAVSVMSSTFTRPWAVGGLTGILYRGIVKNCEVNLNGNALVVEGNSGGQLCGESCLGGLIGRLQGGIVGNVKFAGSPASCLALRAKAGATYTRYYIGGVAGMTNTPKGVFCKNEDEHQLYWGYDNGSTGLDVNNVIVDYEGQMDMLAAKTGEHNYYCRGLLFGETTDTVTVPVVVVPQSYTIESDASATANISGTGIPFTSRTQGVVYDRSSSYSDPANQLTGTLGVVGKLYLCRDGRIPGNGSKCNKYTVVTAGDTELNWGYVSEGVTKTDGVKTETTCTGYSQPYVVATYTGEDAVQSVTGGSANVTYGGTFDTTPYVTIDPDPVTTPTVTWTWSTSAPTDPDVAKATCSILSSGGGDDSSPATLATPSCTTSATNTHSGDRTLISLTIAGGVENFSLTGISSGWYKAVYQDLTSNVVKATAGSTLTLTTNWSGYAMHGYLFIDYNSDGEFSDGVASGTYAPFNVASNGIPAAGSELAIYTVKTSGTDGNNGYRSDGFYGDWNTPNTAVGGTFTYPTFTIPSNLTVGDYRVRFKIDWNSLDPCGTANIGSDGGAMVDFVLRIEAADGGGAATPTPVYCEKDFPEFTTATTAPIEIPAAEADKIFAASEVTVVVNYTSLLGGTHNSFVAASSASSSDYFSCGTSGTGSFQLRMNDNGGYYTRTASVSGNQKAVYVLTASEAKFYLNGTYINNVTATNLTFSAYNNGTNKLYIGGFPISGDDNKHAFVGTIHSLRIYDKALTASEIAALDYNNPCPVTINGCYYEHDFGTVWEGDAAQYTFKLGSVVPDDGVVTDADLTDVYEHTYDSNANTLTVTLNTIAAGTYNSTGAFTFTVGGEDYQVNLRGEVKATKNVTFRVNESGGGKLSLDYGYTATETELQFPNYMGETVTAVPDGPTSIGKWYWSVDGGTTFVELPNSKGRQDWTYDGTEDNVIIKVEFGFAEYEGNFGISKFTDATTKPYFIKRISTTGGIVNINEDDIFTSFNENPITWHTDDETGAVEPIAWSDSERYKFLSGEMLQTKPQALGEQNMTITVEMAHMENFPDTARLMCFVDLNSNGYFDYTHSCDGKSKHLSVRDDEELIFIGARHTSPGTYSEFGNTYTYTESGDDSNRKGIFTFNFSNAGIDNCTFGRIRFIASNYVDAYGLGPVNQYDNYQPRFDSEGDGVVSDYVMLNDNCGLYYGTERENQCDLHSFVNAVDAVFDVVLYLYADGTKDENGVLYAESKTKKVLGDGSMQHMGDLYVESVEDETGIHSGKILFDYNQAHPVGSLIVDGSIVIKKRIYRDRWHHISFPFNVCGTATPTALYDHRIKVFNNAGEIVPINPNSWVLRTFDPAQRNQDGGYGTATVDVADRTVIEGGKFYGFAADPTSEIGDGKDVKTYTDKDGHEWYWVLFYSQQIGWNLSAKQAASVTKTFTADQESSEYNNRNVFAFGNPYLSPVNVIDVKKSPTVNWMNITWWNALTQRYVGVSALDNEQMPPYFGYWVQFTDVDNYTHGVSEISMVFGDLAPTDTNYGGNADEHSHITFKAITSERSTFDMPDSYTIGIDRVVDIANEKPISRTMVTLTDAGRVDEFRAGFDMPVSYAKNSAVPEIWSKAGSSRMMFNDVQRADEVTVPLGIRIHEAGEYVIRLTHTNCNNALVQLRDKRTGAMVELQRDGANYSYSFLAEAGDDERFELVIGAPKNMTDLDIVEMGDDAAEMLVYKTGDVLRLQHVPVGYSVAVCDVVGREVLNAVVTTDDMQLQLPAAQGVYLVRLRNERGVEQQVIKLTR